jgi:hypothetical protein
MAKRGSKNVNDAFNTMSKVKADKARMKAAGITKEDLKRIKKQNIERRKAGFLNWIETVFLSKIECAREPTAVVPVSAANEIRVSTTLSNKQLNTRIKSRAQLFVCLFFSVMCFQEV